MLALLLLSIQMGAEPSQPSLHPLHRPATKVAATGKTRHYFIAADEVIWDYAPLS
jgi:hypothetical protein